MKRTIPIFLILIITPSYLFGQEFDVREYIKALKHDTIELKYITLNNADFYSSPNEIIEILGEPDSIVNPKNECGGFADDDMYIFNQYFYPGFNFIGRNNFYQIEFIDIESSPSTVLNYKDLCLSSMKYLEEWKTLFPKSYKNKYVDGKIESITLLPSILSDDRFIIRFKNGKLINLEYWSPC